MIKLLIIKFSEFKIKAVACTLEHLVAWREEVDLIAWIYCVFKFTQTGYSYVHGVVMIKGLTKRLINYNLNKKKTLDLIIGINLIKHYSNKTKQNTYVISLQDTPRQQQCECGGATISHSRPAVGGNIIATAD